MCAAVLSGKAYTNKEFLHEVSPLHCHPGVKEKENNMGWHGSLVFLVSTEKF